MHEQPSAGVHEKATVGRGVVSVASSNVANLHLTRGQQVDARDRLVADSHVSSNSVNCESAEVAEILEESVVGGAHSQFHLGKLGHHTEVTHLLLTEQH